MNTKEKLLDYMERNRLPFYEKDQQGVWNILSTLDHTDPYYSGIKDFYMMIVKSKEERKEYEISSFWKRIKDAI